MSNPLSISDAPKLVDPKINRTFIKDGARKMQTSDGVMNIAASRSRQLFGNIRGGRYSQLQSNITK